MSPFKKTTIKPLGWEFTSSYFIMKKFILTCLTVLFSMVSYAQKSEFGFFNHLSVGLNGGLTGVGVDLAVPLNNHLQLRAGFSTFPVTITEEFDIEGYYPGELLNDLYGALNLPNEVDVDAKLKMNNVKLLLDLYPSKRSSFHFTAGAFFGGSEVITLNNSQEGSLSAVTLANKYIGQLNQTMGGVHFDPIGIYLDDYLLTADDNGNFKASIETKSVKPYVGIGFGRAVPKRAVGFMFELGAMFWGSPGVYCNGQELQPGKIEGEEGEIIKTISKLSIYPVMNFRLCFKAF